MEKIFFCGKIKFITEKMDFFISPAYAPPPMSTMRLLKFTMINVSECVPSSIGLAFTLGIQIKVKPAGVVNFFSGLMNNCFKRGDAKHTH